MNKQSLKKFVEDWKRESDEFLDNKDPMDIDDFEERNTYNQELGVNQTLCVILEKLNDIEV